jgi:GNAT superfamily N-acetyltransferase
MTLHQYRMREAGPGDLDRVVELIEQRTEWLRNRGSDQWSTNRHRLRPRMTAAIKRGETWVLVNLRHEVLGTVTASTKADPDFWTHEEQQTPALYLSRLATDPRYAGQKLGRIMLRWSLYEAHRRGLAKVRFDAWKTSPGLHDYYRSQGWTYLRTVEAPGRYSGALFSREAEKITDIPELIFDGITDNTGHGTVA